MTTDVREQVRERYAEAATSLSAGCGCGCDCESIGCCGEEATTLFGQGLYGADERAGLPENAVAASLGCGNPLAMVELHEGETVLDLGSGGGIDVLLSGKRVGPTGTVYGLDMTDEMLALAQENARKAGATNVHFLKGLIEDDPARGRERRRRDLELRRQPLAREGQGARRDRPRAAARRPHRDLRRRRRGSALARRPRRARKPCRLHRRRALRLGVPRRARARSASSTSRSSSRTRSPTGCTARSCVRASHSDIRRGARQAARAALCPPLTLVRYDVFGGPSRSLSRWRKKPPASSRPPTRMNEKARATELSEERS